MSEGSPNLSWGGVNPDDFLISTTDSEHELSPLNSVSGALSCYPALQSPEVLVAIMRPLNYQDCTTCARVCRVWSEAAFDRIWASLKTPRHLLELAGDLISTTAGWAYKEPYLPDAGWSSFGKIAPRVRSLAMDLSHDFQDHGLHSDVAAKLLHRLVSSGRCQLLPGLRHLTWNVRRIEDVRAVAPLIPSSLEHLDLLFHGNDLGAEEISLLTKNIGSMAPLLQHLRVRLGCEDAPELQDSVALTLRRLTSLSRLELPDIEAAEVILDALAACPNLQTLELKSLVEEDELPAFMEHIVSACPSPRSITLHLPSNTNPDPNSFLPFKALSALLRCQELHSLRILHPRLVLMKFAEIRIAGQSWPHLQVLHLSGGMTKAYPFGCTPSSLECIAENFGPHLVELGQFFITDNLSKESTPPARFQRLQTMDLGYTDIAQKDVVGIANLFGLICPPHIAIKHAAQSAIMRERWNMVESIVGLVHQGEARGYRQGVQDERDRSTHNQSDS